MLKAAPVPIPYQGSKRRLAPDILKRMPEKIDGALIEPFAGSAAVALAVAVQGRASSFIISDVLEPLAQIWQLIVSDPVRLVEGYEELWLSQSADPQGSYNRIRKEFNAAPDAAKMLYLTARCVKNAVRFNPNGKFNQSPDNRRLGMRPAKMHKEIMWASKLLSGRTQVLASDYRDVLRLATPQDLVYMDPPYEGVSNGKNPRYVQQLHRASFIEELSRLNARDVPFMVSFDGSLGTRTYGTALPAHLGLLRVQLAAGRSSQSTLLGRNEITVESLYLSRSLVHLAGPATTGLRHETADQQALPI